MARAVLPICVSFFTEKINGQKFKLYLLHNIGEKMLLQISRHLFSQMAVKNGKETELFTLCLYKFSHMVVFHWMARLPFNKATAIIYFWMALTAFPLALISWIMICSLLQITQNKHNKHSFKEWVLNIIPKIVQVKIPFFSAFISTQNQTEKIVLCCVMRVKWHSCTSINIPRTDTKAIYKRKVPTRKKKGNLGYQV